MDRGNWVDRLIGYFAPAAYAKRMAMRAQASGIAEMSRLYRTAQRHERAAYDGARRDHRTAGRRIDGGNENAALLRDLTRLRNVSRDQVQSNPYWRSAIASIVSKVVGAGIVPAVRVGGEIGAPLSEISSARHEARSTGRYRLATKREQDYQKRIQRLVRRHLGTLAIDFDRKHNLYGLQALAMRTIATCGEVLIVRYRPKASLRLQVPLQVRVMEPDYLDATKNGWQADGTYCFMGVQFDASGQVSGYHLYDEHPGEPMAKWPKSKLVPAADVIHCFRVDVPGQTRGVPWGASVVMTSWDLADFEDAKLMQQKIAACFVAFWTPGLGQTTKIADANAASGKTVSGTPIELLEPGIVQELPAGSKVDFGSPPQVEGYAEYQRAAVRRIAIGFDVPYEEVSGDMSQVSYISGQLGRLKYERNCDQWRWHMLIPQMCDGIAEWFADASRITLGQAPAFALDWTPPAREIVDVEKHAMGAAALIRNGLSSRQAQVRELGEDPETVMEEQIDDAAAADAAGLKFDSDGRWPATQSKSDTNAVPASIPAEGQ